MQLGVRPQNVIMFLIQIASSLLGLNIPERTWNLKTVLLHILHYKIPYIPQ